MQTLRARPHPSVLLGDLPTQTLRARPCPSFLAGDHPRLQTIPLSKERPEMFHVPAGNSVDAQRWQNARSPESLTLMLQLSMATSTPPVLSSIPVTRLSTMILMLQRRSGQLFSRRHLILHCRPGVFPRRPRVLHRRPLVFPHRLPHILGVYFPPVTFVPVREYALHQLMRQAKPKLDSSKLDVSASESMNSSASAISESGRGSIYL